MLFVPLGRVTNHTDGLLVCQAEELHLLPVERTHLPRVTVQLLRAVLLGFLHVRLTQVLQSQTGHRLVLGQGPAQGAGSILSRPVLLQAGLAEAVAAFEDHGIPEDVAAYGTGEVDLREREPTGHV